METQKFQGKGQLVDRLTAQVGDRGMAIGILKKRGDLSKDGKTLTAHGKKRNSMTASERAKDRAARATGSSTDNFSYNPVTNRAKRIKKNK
jgi:hypothetical protein